MSTAPREKILTKDESGVITLNKNSEKPYRILVADDKYEEHLKRCAELFLGVSNLEVFLVEFGLAKSEEENPGQNVAKLYAENWSTLADLIHEEQINFACFDFADVIATKDTNANLLTYHSKFKPKQPKKHKARQSGEGKRSNTDFFKERKSKPEANQEDVPVELTRPTSP